MTALAYTADFYRTASPGLLQFTDNISEGS